MIDTHSAVKQLMKGGMSESLAETVVQTQRQLVEGDLATKADLDNLATKADLDNLATKVDLEKVRVDLEKVRVDLEHDLASKADLKRDFASKAELEGVRHEVALLRKDVEALDQKVELLDEKFTEKLNRQTSDMTIRLGGLMVLGIAVLEALRRLA